MNNDPSSPRRGMGNGVAFLAGIAPVCAILVAVMVFR